MVLVLPPDVTVARPIEASFLARQLDDVLGSKKRSPTPARADASQAAPQDQSGREPAREGALGPCRTGRAEDAPEPSDVCRSQRTAAEEALATTKAESNPELAAGREKQIVELESSAESRNAEVAELKERLAQIEQARTAETEAAQERADQAAEEAKAQASKASDEAGAAQARAEEARAALERAQADGESVKGQPRERPESR